MVIYERLDDVVTDHIFVRLPGFAPGLDTYAKLEGLNPVGSIKIKTAREMVSAAEAEGRIGAGSRLIESTSGNLGVALSAIAAARGYQVTLVTDPNASARSLQYMRAYGAEVVVIRDHDANGGYLQTRIDWIHRRLAADPGLIWLNQYANPANVRAHRRSTAEAILSGLGEPDWLFIGTGTGGTLMGCVEHLRSVGARSTIVAVDVIGSVIFGGPPAPRLIPGLGSSRPSEIVVDDGAFRVALVSEEDTIRACRRLARDYGLLLGGSSGTVLAAVTAMAPEIPAGSRVLVLAPDQGDGYLDTVYHDDWVRRRFGPEVLTRVNGAARGWGAGAAGTAVLGHA
jgi:cysteine synthase A